MAKPILYGADYSVYVRIARLALIEKRVEHDLVSVDVFAADGLPNWYLGHQPFGRIPAFEHDGFRLYETSAICRYIDEAFDGPTLQPGDTKGRATMAQTVGLLDAYGYKPMVWDVAVERMEKAAPDEALIGAGLEQAGKVLAAVTDLKRPGAWLLGDQLTLADLHAGAVIGYFAKVAEGRALISAHPVIAEWWKRISARESFVATETRN